MKINYALNKTKKIKKLFVPNAINRKRPFVFYSIIYILLFWNLEIPK